MSKKRKANPKTPKTSKATAAGREVKLIRWTLEVASAEFGIARNTLSKRIKSEGIVPGPDKKFSTNDICRAVFTDGEKARAGLAVSQKENWDLRNAKLAGVLADVALFQKVSDEMVLLIRQKISEAPLPEAVKQDLLREVQKIDVNEILAGQDKTADEADLGEEPAPG